MNEDLNNEVEAINSIYGDKSLRLNGEDHVYVLRLPNQDTTLRLRFPPDYPASPPTVLGTQSSGTSARKGEAAKTLELFRGSLGRLYRAGEVCLFDVIEEVCSVLSMSKELGKNVNGTQDQSEFWPEEIGPNIEEISVDVMDLPAWTLSEVVIESKSVFVARSAPVSSPDQATQYLQHLLDSDKKVRCATHNITAWRIKGENEITYQDCDDDGETAAGGRVLRLMQLMNLWNVMIVVTRWYGGHQLGPKRFSIINSVARDAFVKGGFVHEETLVKKKVKR